MGEFKSRGGFGGNKNRGGFGGRREDRRGGFGNKPSFGGNREDRRTELFTAVCDNCHKECQVPFRPSNNKPVYCNDCFSSKREQRPNSFGDKKPQHRGHENKNLSFSSTNDGRIEEFAKQLEALNAKIDKILSLVQGNSKTTPAALASASKPELNKTVKPKVADPLKKATTKKPAKSPVKKKVATKKK